MTLANAPHVGKDARISAPDLPDGESGIFLRRGLDRGVAKPPDGKINQSFPSARTRSPDGAKRNPGAGRKPCSWIAPRSIRATLTAPPVRMSKLMEAEIALISRASGPKSVPVDCFIFGDQSYAFTDST
jgi:hypothetical protein